MTDAPADPLPVRTRKPRGQGHERRGEILAAAKALFIAEGYEGFTTRINELTARESDALLGFLFAHSARLEFILRWQWAVNDIAFWDNRITQHYAVADYLPQRRVMHRATVVGDHPV